MCKKWGQKELELRKMNHKVSANAFVWMPMEKVKENAAQSAINLLKWQRERETAQLKVRVFQRESHSQTAGRI